MIYLGGGCKGEVDGRALDVKVPIDVKKEPFLQRTALLRKEL